MTKVELYVQPDCTLCEEAKLLIRRLKKEVPLDATQIILTEDHPRYKEYLVAVPVVVINGKKELLGNITEQSLREALGMAYKLTPMLSGGKFLEALGFITVFVGLIYGFLGDMWTDLYFFLSGIVVFAAGRMLEKREMKRQHLKAMAE
ncbi:MAG: glutaredoxin family protein [Ignavibacteriae bacterium]|nr:glutaredoxin family protein [Ignavibacteriota bacterium]